MNILSFERNQVVAAAKCGIMNKASILHYDVCRALSEGKTQDHISEVFCIDVETVKQIKRTKCRECNAC